MAYTIEQLEPHLIGRGAEKRCFRLPEDPGALIKVSARAQSKQVGREIRYYRALKRRGVPFTFLADFLGEVDLGPDYRAVAQQCIADPGGELSPTLHGWLMSHPEEGLAALRGQLLELKAYLIAYNIQPADLNCSNVCVQTQADGSLRLFLVDGIGEFAVKPLGHYIPWLGRWRIERRWRRFEKKLLRSLEQARAARQGLG